MYSAVVIKKLCRGDESLEGECSSQSLEVDNDQMRASSKLILLTIRELAGELNTNCSMVVQHVKQTGKVGASWHDCKSKKSSLILCNNNAPFLFWIVMCDEKWILYNDQWQPAQWLDGEEAPKYFLKPNLYQKKKGHGPCLVVCCLCHLQQFSESWWHDYIWEVCSANPQDALKTSTSTAVFYQ